MKLKIFFAITAAEVLVGFLFGCHFLLAAAEDREESIIQKSIVQYPLSYREKPIGYREMPPNYDEKPVTVRETPFGYNEQPETIVSGEQFQVEPRNFRENPPGFTEKDNIVVANHDPSLRVANAELPTRNTDPSKTISREELTDMLKE